jgi:AraC family transcriptional regulator
MTGEVGGALGDRFGLPRLRSHVSRSLASGRLAVTELVSDVPTPEPTASLPPDDAVLVGLQLSASDHEMWFDGRATPSPHFAAGETCFYDLRRDPVVFIRGPYRSLQFYIPNAQLGDLAAEAGGKAPDELGYRLGAAVADPIIHHLGQAILPAFDLSGGADSLFLDQVLQALATHVVHRYGEVTRRRAPASLARWQERRAKELLSAHLHEKVALADLARACDLSVSHFARAFRATTGAPPHRWLLFQRIERAKSLLRTAEPLSHVALACGFADQSHFTRVFSRVTGVSPGAWRAEYGAPGAEPVSSKN